MHEYDFQHRLPFIRTQAKCVWGGGARGGARGGALPTKSTWQLSDLGQLILFPYSIPTCTNVHLIKST